MGNSIPDCSRSSHHFLEKVRTLRLERDVLVTRCELVKVGLRVWTGSQLAANSLHPNAGYLLHEIWPATEKVFVVVAGAVNSRCQATKPIEIHLALEGSQLGLTEISANQMSKERGETGIGLARINFVI